MDEAFVTCMTVTTGSHVPRKLFHLTAASMIPTVYYFEPVARQSTLYLTLAVTVAWVIGDIARIKIDSVNRLFKTLFGSFMKVKEENSLTGSSYVLIGSSFALLLFSPAISCASIYFMSIGDPSAALAGKPFGKTRFGKSGKSVEGSAAMFLVCLIIGYAIIGSVIMAVTGAVAGAVTEFFTGPLDDNLSIPLVAGGAMTACQWLY